MSKYSNINSWTHFDPLKQVVLGNVYEPKFFDDLPDDSIRQSIQKVLRETIEDLNGIKKILEDLGVEVIQIDSNFTQDGHRLPYKTFGEWKEDNPIGSLPKPMINPRDNYITLGNEIVCTIGHSSTKDHPLYMFDNVNIELCKQFNPNKLGPFTPTLEGQFDVPVPKTWNPSWDDPKYFEANSINNPKDFSEYVWKTWYMAAATLTRVGNTLIVDEVDRLGFYDWYSKIRPNHKFTKNTVAIGGHNDGSMCLPKEGLVLGCTWMTEDFFKKTFPNWDCMIIDNPNDFKNQHPKDYKELTKQQFERKIKKKKNIRWFVKDKMKDHKFVTYVDQWLYDWIGMQDETLFENNMLSLDERNIFSLNYQKEIHDKLNSVGIRPIYIPFRHKRFWDSGLHCLTLDTYREGTCREIKL